MHTKDQHLLSIMPCHPVSQPDFLPEVMNVRVFHESVVRDFGEARGGDGENGDGFSLIDREIDAVVIQVVFEDYDGRRVNSCV